MTNPNLPPLYSICDISQLLKSHIENEFGYVRLKGEISGLKIAGSGHAYFSLKDASAVINGICWRGDASKFSSILQEGNEVIATGRVTTYPQSSRYQIIVQNLEVAGIGALLKMLQERRERLANEGLFAAPKKTIPLMPKMIGVISSPTGAVIHDILHRIKERMPTHIVLAPVPVQGEGAAIKIAEAISNFNKMTNRPDILIIARGGGSLEDLWAFNEEILVRAAGICSIPIISAIGHETDHSLLDEVADLRAPTPSAAAEYATQQRHELLQNLGKQQARLNHILQQKLKHQTDMLMQYSKFLGAQKNIFEGKNQRLDIAVVKLSNAVDKIIINANARAQRLSLPSCLHNIERKENALKHLSQKSYLHWQEYYRQRGERFNLLAIKLESYSYKNILKRGFVLVKDRKQNLMKTATQATEHHELTLQFIDSELNVSVIKNINGELNLGVSKDD